MKHMNRLEKASVLVALTERLREYGSWAGETHLQKATYMLERVLKVPFDFEFILYKHGPFSFDLREEIGCLRSDGFLGWEIKSEKYGPSLRLGPMGEALKRQFAHASQRYAEQVEFIASRLRDKNVATLERLATAVFVTVDEKCPEEQRSSRIHMLKPHVSVPEAEAALIEADKIIREAATVAA